MARRALPFEVGVSIPCNETWEEMTGNKQRRHCGSCNKQVHNLAALTPRQIEDLVGHGGAHLCARVTRREDGSLVTLEPTALPSPLATFMLSATVAIVPVTAVAQTSVDRGKSFSQPANQSPVQLPATHTAVSGVITDIQGALVVGSTVTLKLDGVQVGMVKTNEVGRFEFAVNPGEYELGVISPGFAPSSKSLSVTAENASVADVALRPGTQVTVQVTAQSLANSTTMGVMVASYGPWYKRWEYHLRHPVVYAKYLLHAY